MSLIEWIKTRRLLAFICGTIFIQGGLFLGAVISHSSFERSDTQLSLKNEVSSSLITPKTQAKPSSEFEQALLSSAGNTQDKRFSLQAEQKIGADSQPASEPEVETEAPGRTVEYTLGSGDTLSKIWKKFGAPYSGSLKAAKALKNAGVKLSSLRAGDKIELRILDTDDIVEFRKKLSKGRTVLLQGDSKQGYQSQIIEPQIEDKERVVMGTINSSFSEVATELNVPYSVIDQLVDLFGSRVEFRRDIQPGDQFALVYLEQHITTPKEKETIAGPIQSASLKVNGEMMVAVRHVGKDGRGRYFDKEGESLEGYFLRYPLRFTRISSVFSKSRFHPVLKRNRPHNGVDFAAPHGTPVRAVADGKITIAGTKGGNGKMVKIQHDSRYSTAYLHLSKIDSKVRQGKRVKRGQVIGKVGSTGLSTGPHLHFSFYDRGRYVDPLKVKLPRQPVSKENRISVNYLQAALKTLQDYHHNHSLATIAPDA